MAIRSISQLKSWFKKGMYPTELQFGDWLDSFVHKDDSIPIGKVEGLTDIINRKAELTDLTRMDERVELVEQGVNDINNIISQSQISAIQNNEIDMLFN